MAKELEIKIEGEIRITIPIPKAVELLHHLSQLHQSTFEKSPALNQFWLELDNLLRPIGNGR